MNRTFNAALAVILLGVIIQSSGCLTKTSGDKAGPVNIIPRPVEIKYHDVNFRLTDDVRIFFQEGLEETARLAARQLKLTASRDSGRNRRGIFLTIDSTLHHEGYKLKTGRKRIDISGGSDAGVCYAIQTLRQLSATANVPGQIPGIEIYDWPRFRWRGLMLDCSRTFQSLDYLRNTIDRLSFYRMNVLHLHLTDDQGWRMEIKSHPELTITGARFHPDYNEPEEHQGYYTHEELRDLVRYAALRGITIVPEIEMPGHCYAALACYPDLSCTGKIDAGIFPYSKGPGITSDILCAGNEKVFSFIEDVINEVVEVFPSQYIHIGGDEAPKEKWEKCPKCQARIKEEGLKDEKELQSYFVNRVERLISAKGRRLIGWSEIIEGGLPPNTAVMDWIGGAGEATGAGQDVVMSPTTHCYFDYTYKAISTEHAYSFNPVSGLTAEQAKHVIGLQANFWSHIDREPELVDKQLFPRLLSVAERGWSPAEVQDRDDFMNRLEKHLPLLEEMKINYYREER